MLFLDACTDLAPVINLLKAILGIIQWGIPIILIIMGSIDLGKAVLASDDKEIKGATSKLVKRAIAAVAVFFIPLLVNMLMKMVANNGTSTSTGGEKNFVQCWADDGTNQNT